MAPTKRSSKAGSGASGEETKPSQEPLEGPAQPAEGESSDVKRIVGEGLSHAMATASAGVTRHAEKARHPLAPPTKETFDELAERAAKAEPRRGSVTQPPPAWEPDEVTLTFATVTERSGETHELNEQMLLATILIAVENNRRGILHRVAAGFEEEIDAVANLFWPFLLVHAGPEGRTAIFDGTCVWRRTLRYTRMPPMVGIQPLLDRTRSPEDYLSRMKALAPHFVRDAGAEVLTVEGFLPLDPPLLFDVLTQSRYRGDPQAPHAGFLPARHDVVWYREEVDQMRSWLERFEQDIRSLGDIRAKIDQISKASIAHLEDEYRKLQLEAKTREQAAAEEAYVEIDRVHEADRSELKRQLEAIRRAHGVVAHGESMVATSEALAFRATHRRADPAPHQARGREAQGAVHAAHRQMAESRREIEAVHERQRAAQEAAISRVAEVERSSAKKLAERELFRDEYAATAAELLQSIDGQMAARSTQRNLITGYFLPLASLSEVRVVWFPLWMATLRSAKGGVRQIVFPPMQVRSTVGLGGALKRLFGGIVLPLEPRTAQFDKVLRPTMEEALVRDPWLTAATQELTRAADVLVDPDLLSRLQAGLGELRRDGWITAKQETEYYRVYADRARHLLATGQAAAGLVPRGAQSEAFEGASGNRSAPSAGPDRDGAD